MKNVDYDRDGTVDRIYMTFETIVMHSNIKSDSE